MGLVRVSYFKQWRLGELAFFLLLYLLNREHTEIGVMLWEGRCQELCFSVRYEDPDIEHRIISG